MRKNNKLLPLLILSTMLFIGLAMLATADSCTTGCDDGATIVGITACNATITSTGGTGNWTNMSLFFYSAGTTTNTTGAYPFINDTTNGRWSNSTVSNGTGGLTLNVTLDSTQFADGSDYTAQARVQYVTNSTLLNCTSVTNRVVNNGIPRCNQLTSLGSSVVPGAKTVYFFCINTTSYIVRVGAKQYKERTTIASDFVSTNQSATLSALPNTGNWTVEATDGNDVVNYGSTFTLGGYSEEQKALRNEVGVDNVPIPTSASQSTGFSKKTKLIVILGALLAVLVIYYKMKKK